VPSIRRLKYPKADLAILLGLVRAGLTYTHKRHFISLEFGTSDHKAAMTSRAFQILFARKFQKHSPADHLESWNHEPHAIRNWTQGIAANRHDRLSSTLATRRRQCPESQKSCKTLDVWVMLSRHYFCPGLFLGPFTLCGGSTMIIGNRLPMLRKKRSPYDVPSDSARIIIRHLTSPSRQVVVPT
jgi:hypothetical protein